MLRSQNLLITLTSQFSRSLHPIGQLFHHTAATPDSQGLSKKLDDGNILIHLTQCSLMAALL
ncbi:MAG TPA: hypothetical protein V6C64_11185 [Microcoleaceae cyanobacterium]